MPATITLRLDDSTKAALDDYCRARGISISDALRAGIDQVLGIDRARDLDDGPVNLGIHDRHLLATMHEILLRLTPDDDPYEKEYRESRIKALQEGYALEYGTEFESIYPELSRDECRFVWDVLDMFRAAKASIARLSEEDREQLSEAETRALTYLGFDGNDSTEGRMAGYVRYLLETDRWTDLQDDWNACDRGNSHMPTLATYRRQLAVFQPIWTRRMRELSVGGSLLSLDELRQVAAARAFPKS